MLRRGNLLVGSGEGLESMCKFVRGTVNKSSANRDPAGDVMRARKRINFLSYFQAAPHILRA